MEGVVSNEYATFFRLSLANMPFGLSSKTYWFFFISFGNLSTQMISSGNVTFWKDLYSAEPVYLTCRDWLLDQLESGLSSEEQAQCKGKLHSQSVTKLCLIWLPENHPAVTAFQMTRVSIFTPFHDQTGHCAKA